MLEHLVSILFFDRIFKIFQYRLFIHLIHGVIYLIIIIMRLWIFSLHRFASVCIHYITHIECNLRRKPVVEDKQLLRFGLSRGFVNSGESFVSQIHYNFVIAINTKLVAEH